MHYYALVQIENTENIEAQVEVAMEPHRERHDGEEASGFWDWYQIGGRWMGHLDGYDPRSDRRNMSVCRLCDGTGKRVDDLGKHERTHNPDYGCNGCDDTGIELKWPTEWVRREGFDAARRQDIPDDKKPHTLVVNGSAIEREAWDGNDFIDTQADLDAAWDAIDPDALLVVVDYHC